MRFQNTKPTTGGGGIWIFSGRTQFRFSPYLPFKSGRPSRVANFAVLILRMQHILIHVAILFQEGSTLFGFKSILYIPTVVMPHCFIAFRKSSFNSQSLASVMLLCLMTQTGTAYSLKLRSSSLIMKRSKWEAASLFLVVTPMIYGSSSFFSAETSA